MKHAPLNGLIGRSFFQNMCKKSSKILPFFIAYVCTAREILRTGKSSQFEACEVPGFHLTEIEILSVQTSYKTSFLPLSAWFLCSWDFLSLNKLRNTFIRNAREWVIDFKAALSASILKIVVMTQLMSIGLIVIEIEKKEKI